MNAKWKVGSIGSLVAVVIGVLIAVELIKVGFPLLMTGFASLGGLGGNFTFATFFQSAGLMSIVLSAIVLIGILAIIGVSTKSHR